MRFQELNPMVRKKRWRDFTQEELPSRQSIVVGLSSCAIALPGIAALPCDSCIFAPHGNWVHFLVCINAALWSFLADYTFAGNSAGSIRSLGFEVHRVDRYNAFFSITFFSIEFVRAGLLPNLICCISFLCAGFLYSRNAPTPESWFFRHAVWHAVLVVILFYAIHVLDGSQGNLLV